MNLKAFQHPRGYCYRTVFASQNIRITQNIELYSVLLYLRGKGVIRLHEPQRCVQVDLALSSISAGADTTDSESESSCLDLSVYRGNLSELLQKLIQVRT